MVHSTIWKRGASLWRSPLTPFLRKPVVFFPSSIVSLEAHFYAAYSTLTEPVTGAPVHRLRRQESITASQSPSSRLDWTTSLASFAGWRGSAVAFRQRGHPFEPAAILSSLIHMHHASPHLTIRALHCQAVFLTIRGAAVDVLGFCPATTSQDDNIGLPRHLLFLCEVPSKDPFDVSAAASSSLWFLWSIRKCPSRGPTVAQLCKRRSLIIDRLSRSAGGALLCQILTFFPRRGSCPQLPFFFVVSGWFLQRVERRLSALALHHMAEVSAQSHTDTAPCYSRIFSQYSSPSFLAKVGFIRTAKKPSHAAIAGAVVGGVLFLISFIAMFLFFLRRRRASTRPTGLDKLGGVERGPDPSKRDSAHSNLLTGDGQPAGGEDAFDGASVSDAASSKRSLKTPAPIAVLTSGITQGASLAGGAVMSAGGAVMSFQRRLFKRGTKENATTEMEMEPSALGSAAPTDVLEDSAPEALDSAPEVPDTAPQAPRPGFFAKVALKTKKSLTAESTAKESVSSDAELAPSAVEGGAPATSTPHMTRAGFFAKIAKKVKKEPTTESATDSLAGPGDDGLTFQQRLFKRPTTDSTTETVPEAEGETEARVLSEEPWDVVDLQQEAPSEAEIKEMAVVPETKGSGTVMTLRQFFKRTLSETTAAESGGLGTDTSAIDEQPATVESAPKGSFILKMRHKFSKPNVVPDPEAALDEDASDAHIIQPGEDTDTKTDSASTSMTGGLSRISTAGHSSEPPPAIISPPAFDADATPTTPTIGRSLSTMKRDQTRAAHGESSSHPPEGEVPVYEPPPSFSAASPPIIRSLSTMKPNQMRMVNVGHDEGDSSVDAVPPVEALPAAAPAYAASASAPAYDTSASATTSAPAYDASASASAFTPASASPAPTSTSPTPASSSAPAPAPTLAAPPSVTRSLSTMKRDQTQVTRDPEHTAMDVLVQTPGGLQLLPGQSRVVSTDESRAVASELRDLREYIRVLEADLAVGGRSGAGQVLPPPPSYDETR
ncbi:hypothetical protein DFH06DRAFT_1143249 [Mycena polygramma]|nr:hypothetical protein DFH06DRAFT_1143249 [Mycena polygramma]